MKILIVDDEPLAREELRRLLEERPGLAVIGECANAIEAIGAINRQAPDVVFLDIQMPRVSGLEMLSMLDPERMPRIVFLTAHDEYAVQAFEEHAFDYLLKPVDPARLDKTLGYLRRDRAPQDTGPLREQAPLRQIPCSGLNRIVLLKLEEVECVVSKASGIFVLAADGQERFTELTLHTLQERTPLFRCHRQYLVNADRIKEIRLIDNGLAEILTLGGQTIPVSRRFLGPLKERLGIG
ncbi:two-component system response regulator BtsR [Azospirillum doebereinerae]|uniref:Two-component system response regulator YehT n=1 Tax=Azospirillum doebereinerae TaxID=92933 RepID=A0A433J0X9_9PROT|nr:two-component system response regulator BtsR [Azospirillum doebereinerae]MCG5240519.1 two-component system response regulator BtsR [Azospirillum doebereinerae]RUQ63679.1 two-component system response regulator YehT [Azospirillum doebereinerae]